MIRYAYGIFVHYFSWPCALGALLTGLITAAAFRLCAKRGIAVPFRAWASVVLCVYLFLTLWFMILGRSWKNGNLLALEPFWSYRAIRRGRQYLVYLDVLNVLVFVPIGILLPLAWPKAGLRRTLALGAGYSLLVELLQLLLHRGLFELDDLFHNFLGTVLGAGLCLAAQAWLRRRIGEPTFPAARASETLPPKAAADVEPACGVERIGKKGAHTMKRVITYGTFDLLHYGHINLLRRAKALGDYLIVVVSTDEFNWNEKSKKCYFNFEQRKALVEAIRYVDLVIPEESWEQKRSDMHEYHIDTFVMGDDWTGKFDFLREEGVEVVYLPRTPEISSSQIKQELHDAGEKETPEQA